MNSTRAARGRRRHCRGACDAGGRAGRGGRERMEVALDRVEFRKIRDGDVGVGRGIRESGGPTDHGGLACRAGRQSFGGGSGCDRRGRPGCSTPPIASTVPASPSRNSATRSNWPRSAAGSGWPARCGRLKGIQDILGVLHDDDVLAGRVRDCAAGCAWRRRPGGWRASRHRARRGYRRRHSEFLLRAPALVVVFFGCCTWAASTQRSRSTKRGRLARALTA